MNIAGLSDNSECFPSRGLVPERRGGVLFSLLVIGKVIYHCPSDSLRSTLFTSKSLSDTGRLYDLQHVGYTSKKGSVT